MRATWYTYLRAWHSNQMSATGDEFPGKPGIPHRSFERLPFWFCGVSGEPPLSRIGHGDGRKTNLPLSRTCTPRATAEESRPTGKLFFGRPFNLNEFTKEDGMLKTLGRLAAGED